MESFDYFIQSHKIPPKYHFNDFLFFLKSTLFRCLYFYPCQQSASKKEFFITYFRVPNINPLYSF